MEKFFKEVTEKLGLKEYSHSFLCFNKSNNLKWFIKRVELPEEHIKDITRNFNESLGKPLQLIDYEQYSTDNVYRFNGENLIQHAEMKSNILGKANETNELMKEEKKFTIETAEKLPVTGKIEFVIHFFNENGQDILLFTKHQGSSLMKKTIYSFSDNEFKEIDKENLYLFNTNVTCACINDHYYIFDVDKFTGLFKYWDKLKEMRDDVIQDIQALKIVSNFEEYNEIYQKFYNLKSIIKIKEANIDLKEYISDNKDRFEQICTENNLSLTFDKRKESFNITANEGVTVLNRILSGRSGHHLSGHFITFPSFIGYEKK